ncbi:MAG TPA: hypothetical protein VF650_04200 [Allosphingosinicella sp.]|jgi:hypothetical protein
MAKKGYPSSHEGRPAAKVRDSAAVRTDIAFPPADKIVVGTARFFDAAKDYGFITTGTVPIHSGRDVRPGSGPAPEGFKFFETGTGFEFISPGSGSGSGPGSGSDPNRYRPESDDRAGPGAASARRFRYFADSMHVQADESRKLEPEPSEQAPPGEITGRALFVDDPIVDAAVTAVVERVPEIVRARQEALSQENIDLLVDAYLKSAPTAPARHQIEMDNARERARFVEEFPCYTSREVAELAGHEAVNASATATRWKKARRILGLPWKGGDLYPAFQFREGRPRPILARLIECLPEGMSPWQVAFWLTSSNGWLGGSRPLERLDDEAALLAAAARESETLGG